MAADADAHSHPQFPPPDPDPQPSALKKVGHSLRSSGRDIEYLHIKERRRRRRLRAVGLVAWPLSGEFLSVFVQEVWVAVDLQEEFMTLDDLLEQMRRRRININAL